MQQKFKADLGRFFCQFHVLIHKSRCSVGKGRSNFLQCAWTLINPALMITHHGIGNFSGLNRSPRPRMRNPGGQRLLKLAPV